MSGREGMVSVMDCSRAQMVIDEVGDLDRLPLDAARHVAACPACERFGIELLELRALLREPDRISVPPNFDIALAKRVRESRALSSRSHHGLGWLTVPRQALVGAMALCIIGLGTLTYLSRPTNSSSTAPVTVAGVPGVATPVGGSGGSEAITDVPDGANPDVIVPQSSGNGDGTSVSRRPLRPIRAAVAPRERANQAMLLISDEVGTRAGHRADRPGGLGACDSRSRDLHFRSHVRRRRVLEEETGGPTAR